MALFMIIIAITFFILGLLLGYFIEKPDQDVDENGDQIPLSSETIRSKWERRKILTGALGAYFFVRGNCMTFAPDYYPSDFAFENQED